MRRLSRRAAALTAVASSVALAAPALAANVDVTVIGLGGTRQFSVEDLSGASLSALNLGTGQAQPFRTHVADSNFLPASALTDDYSVNATMSNLYLKTGSSYDYAVKIASSDLKIDFGSTPLSGTGVSLKDLPKLSLTGTLSSCASMPSSLQSALGLNSSGLPIVSSLPLSTLCTTLLNAQTRAVTAQVDGVAQTLTPVINSVLDLPSALGGATGGTFSNPSFAAGTVGAGDTAGASGAQPATAVSLMTGTHGLSTNLVAALKTALNNALAGLNIVPTGTGASKSTLAAVIAGLNANPATSVAGQLGAVLQGLASDTDKATVINGLGLSASALDPVLADIAGITGSYYAFPILSATPNAPVPGTYGGTMTVTFVQS